MSVARVRALTHTPFIILLFLSVMCRNECCPCEGIDTFLKICRDYILLFVDMNAAKQNQNRFLR